MASINDDMQKGAGYMNENYAYSSSINEVQDSFGVQRVPIYIYNISPQEFNCPRPPNHPHMLLKACPKGEDYVLVGTITHPFNEVKYDHNFIGSFVLADGFKEATRMLNPLNHLTYNPRVGVNSAIEVQNHSAPDTLIVGGNLNAYGVFWSVNNPPEKAEIAAARVRMERSYKEAIEEMVKIESGPGGPEEARARAGFLHHAAADYYGQSFSWHRSDLIPKSGSDKTECQACGEMINAKARICKECGAPTDPIKLDSWLEQKFAEKRSPGRPPNPTSAA